MAEDRVERSGGSGAQAPRARRRRARRRRRRAGRGRPACAAARAGAGPAASAPAGGPGASRRTRANGLASARPVLGDGRASGVGLAGPDAGEHDEGLGRGGHPTRSWTSVRNRSHSRAKRSSLQRASARRSNAVEAVAQLRAPGRSWSSSPRGGRSRRGRRVDVLVDVTRRPGGSGTAPGSRAPRRTGPRSGPGTTRTNASMYWIVEPSNVVRKTSVRGAARSRGPRPGRGATGRRATSARSG